MLDPIQGTDCTCLKVLGEANEKADGAAGRNEAGRTAQDAVADEEKDIQGGLVTCSVTNIFDTGDIFASHADATHVAVGIFVINIQNSRNAQKNAAAHGDAATYYVDFLLTVTQPPGSTLWTDDEAMWDTLTFRNVKDIFESKAVEGTQGARRIQASFYYDPDLSMYPMDSQRLRIIVQQTKHTTNKWEFVPSPELNGMSKDAPDIQHKSCSGDADSEEIGGKQYSAFTFTVNVRKPRWFAIITAFIPPMLIILPVVLGHTLGPLSWYDYPCVCGPRGNLGLSGVRSMCGKRRSMTHPEWQVPVEVYAVCGRLRFAGILLRLFHAAFADVRIFDGFRQVHLLSLSVAHSEHPLTGFDVSHFSVRTLLPSSTHTICS